MGFRDNVSEFKDSVMSPVKEDIPLAKLAMYVILFGIVAFILFDTLKILATWIKNNAESAASAVSDAVS